MGRSEKNYKNTGEGGIVQTLGCKGQRRRQVKMSIFSPKLFFRGSMSYVELTCE